MSVNHPNIQTIENNDEVYTLWKDLNLQHANVLHIDAHLDYRDDNAGIHIGNYLKQAIEEQLAQTVYWIVPGSCKQFIAERKKIVKKLQSAGISGTISQTNTGITAKINKSTLIVCPLALLPKRICEPYVIDIDLDFLFFPSCLSADRTENIGQRSSWITNEDFADVIKKYLGNSILTTLCYSTTGAWTPMQYRHFGDQILLLLGQHDNNVHQRIVAGSFFSSFHKYFRRNELSKARRYYRSALTLNPKYLNFYMTDGPLFLLKGDLIGAGNEFSKLQQIDQKNLYGQFGMGLIELLSGNMKKAKKMMQKARSITNNKEIILFLIYIQSHLGEHEPVKKLIKEYRNNAFPKKPLKQMVLQGILTEISEKLENEQQLYNIGQMFMYPNPQAVTTWEKLVKYSPNNIGNWTEEPEHLRHTAAAIELDLIEKMANLYFENSNEYGGYMTTGATEGNIFSAWIGRKYLESIPNRSEIVLLANDLTHYSVIKAADIIGVTVHKIPVHIKDWNSDVDTLLDTIIRLKRKGISKFLIPLTLGYTVGGTNDHVQKIIQGLRTIKEKDQIEYFLWVDAALSGLTMPFLVDNYRSYFPAEIRTVIVDFHKVLGVPMPAGLVLYQKKLARYTKSSIPYLSISDSTLLGSRNGVSPIAAWMSIHQFGFEKMSQHLRKELSRKKSLLREMRDKFPIARIITDKYSLHAALEVQTPLPEEIIQHYGLHLRRYPINGQIRLIYPLFFLPHWRHE